MDVFLNKEPVNLCSDNQKEGTARLEPPLFRIVFGKYTENILFENRLVELIGIGWKIEKVCVYLHV